MLSTVRSAITHSGMWPHCLWRIHFDIWQNQYNIVKFKNKIKLKKKEAGKKAWYSHLFKKFSQFVVIHIVKGFSIVNKAEVDFFFNSLAFLWSN